MGRAAIDMADGAAPGDGRLYREHHARILAYCARRVGRGDAADIAADVFTVAWQRLDAVPLGDDALPWLYGVAYRAISHHWRGLGRRSRLTTKLAGQRQISVDGPESQIVRNADLDMVIAAAARLRQKDQEVLRLVIWEELAHRDIAVVLGCSEASARQRFHRAKKALLGEYVRLGGVVPIPAVAQEGGDQ